MMSSALAFNSYDNSDKFTASFPQGHYSTSHSIDKCFDGSNTSGECSSIQGGTMSIVFKSPSDVTNLNLTLASTLHVYDYLEVDGIRYEYDLSGIYNFPNFTNITVFAKSTSYVHLKEITFDFVNTPIIHPPTDGNSCAGYSCWFPTQQDFRDTFLALLMLMTVVFSLGYIGKIVRTGGES